MAWDEIKGEHGTIIAHVGGVLRTRDALRECFTPNGTETYKPVAHYDLVAKLIADIESRGIRVGRDAYITQDTPGCKDALLLGFMDLGIPGLARPDFGMGLGISTGNDVGRSKAIRVVAASRVFVCDNRAFSGDAGAVFLRKAHTKNLNIASVIPPAIDLFLEKANHFVNAIDMMKDEAITDDRAKALILDSFMGRVIPQHLTKDVVRLYLEDEEQRERFPERTLWSLNNAYTEATKQLDAKSPASRMRVESSVGGFFGKVLMRSRRSSVVMPEGVEEITAAEAYRNEDVEVEEFAPDGGVLVN